MNNKLTNAYRIFAITLMILGIIHCTMVFVYFDSMTSEAIFSLGTGIAVLFLGLLNFSASRILTPLILKIAIVANAIQTLYGLLSLTVMDDPPNYVGVFIFLTVLILSLIVKKRKIMINEI